MDTMLLKCGGKRGEVYCGVGNPGPSTNSKAFYFFFCSNRIKSHTAVALILKLKQPRTNSLQWKQDKL